MVVAPDSGYGVEVPGHDEENQMLPFESNPEDADLDAAPEGATDDARPDDEDVRDPDPEQPDPESGAAADEPGS
jgi:hypothetical protein